MVEDQFVFLWIAPPPVLEELESVDLPRRVDRPVWLFFRSISGLHLFGDKRGELFFEEGGERPTLALYNKGQTTEEEVLGVSKLTPKPSRSGTL